jgi:hypothetical protein
VRELARPPNTVTLKTSDLELIDYAGTVQVDMTGDLMADYVVGQVAATVPEPGVLSLALTGGAALLALRHLRGRRTGRAA